MRVYSSAPSVGRLSWIVSRRKGSWSKPLPRLPQKVLAKLMPSLLDLVQSRLTLVPSLPKEVLAKLTLVPSLTRLVRSLARLGRSLAKDVRAKMPLTLIPKLLTLVPSLLTLLQSRQPLTLTMVPSRLQRKLRGMQLDQMGSEKPKSAAPIAGAKLMLPLLESSPSLHRH